MTDRFAPKTKTVWQGAQPVFPCRLPSDVALRTKRAVSLCRTPQEAAQELPRPKPQRREWTPEENAILRRRWRREGASPALLARIRVEAARKRLDTSRRLAAAKEQQA